MPTQHPVLRRLLRIVALAEDSLLIALLALMIGLAATQIFMRNVMGSGVTGADQLLRVLVLWLGMLGAVTASRGDRHINIDILSRFLGERARTLCRLAIDVFAALVCGLIAVHSARFVISEYEAGVSAFGRFPAWITEIILPVAFSLIAARYVVMFFVDLRHLREGAPPE